ncbi:MATE family efflux transporter [bacterium]|nr:MATE family efflux transporter [bacterium]PJA74592.1 MAG: MATE family efflux transporter [bacterium CG_4_9_14_3_um_filter_65_15]
MSRTATLTTGPVGPGLLRMAGPMLAGMIAIMAFNLVDTFFLGRFSTDALTAISFTFPVVMSLASLALGLGMGTSAVISNAIGEGDHQGVQRLTTDALILSFVIVVVVAAAGMFTVRPLFAAMGAKGEILDLVVRYMRIWYLTIGVLVIPMVGNSAIRATGDTRTPAMIMGIAALTNVIADPILIFGWGPVPRMGIEGAAIATALARATSLTAAIYVLGVRKKMLSRRGMTLSTMLASSRRILHVGLPAAATRMVMPLGMGVIIRLVAQFGPAAVAAYGVGTRVGMFAFAVIMALGASLVPFIGQNLGARRLDRVHDAAWFSVKFGMGYGLLTWVVFLIFARPIAALFNGHEGFQEATVLFFRIAPVGAVFSAAAAMASTVLNGMLKPLRAASLSVLQIFVLTIPLSILGARVAGLAGVFWAGVVANIVTAGVGLFVMSRAMKQEQLIAPVALEQPL